MCDDLIVKLAEAADKLVDAMEVLDKSGLSAALAQNVVEHAHNYFAGLWPVTPRRALETLVDEMILALETGRAHGVKFPEEAQAGFYRFRTSRHKGRPN